MFSMIWTYLLWPNVLRYTSIWSTQSQDLEVWCYIRNFRVEYANARWNRSWNFDIDKLGKLQIRWNYDAYTYTVIKSINLSLYCCQFCTKYMFINRTIKPFFYAISVSENRLTSCKPFNRFKMAQLCMWKKK